MNQTVMKDYQCLMIKTKDRRRFFTHEKNYLPLLEFSKMFKAEVSVVHVRQAQVLELSELAPALCNVYSAPPPAEYDVLEVKIPQTSRRRREILKNAAKIRKHIRKQFLDGRTVSLRELAKKFVNLNVTLACLCKHVTRVRQELHEQGYRLEKTGGGKYRLAQ